ncbi:MAG: 2-succinyl-5-enolpyruvyl-6-hydroxy-3-cyclohexene-1-carboxylic-acid synthase [Flavobacteriales bacterium]
MKISNKISVQKTVEFCQKQGVQDIVISPGSRNAPFTISFTNNPFFNCYSMVDERSAAHFALGIAQQKKGPVAIVSTSGTATLNYAPAIAEAHMQGIPLLVITADRQSNGLEIGDGQVINQKGVYQNFCENNYSLVEDENDLKDLNSAIIQEAFFELKQKNKTVHLNVQLSEPLYDTIEVQPLEIPVLYAEESLPIFSVEKIDEFIKKWNSFSSKLIIITENQYDWFLHFDRIFKKDKNVVVLTETTASQYDKVFNSCIDRTIELIDKENPEGFIPDLIVTFGHSVISKKVKQLFRSHKPKEHWSFSKVRNENLFEMDSFENREDLIEFISIGNELALDDNPKTDFKTNWDRIQKQTKESHLSFVETVPFSDLKVFEYLTKNLPACNLQMGNSSVVRYIQLFDQREDITYNGNRGISGIEGCTSTAIGACSVTKNSILISGDISFFYDSNAFWHNHVPANFKVIVINNGEGNIFKILPYPQEDKTSLPFFTTPHQTSIKKFCDLYNLAYFRSESIESLSQNFDKFIENNEQPSVLEIDTSKADNDTILKEYFNFLKQNNYVNTHNGK